MNQGKLFAVVVLPAGSRPQKKKYWLAKERSSSGNAAWILIYAVLILFNLRMTLKASLQS